MTAVLDRAPAPAVPRLRRDRRRWAWGLAALVAVGWSLAGAVDGDVLNPAGVGQFGRFAAAALSPAVDGAFLGVLATAALVTVAYAVLGAALALLLGALGAVLVARTTWGRRRLGWTAARGVLAVPRGLHEAVWGLLLVNVLGLDPWVGVLAIGLPYGAVTAKVFADLLDEVPRGPYAALLAAGSGRVAAALYGLLPQASGGLLSYAFYRLECAVRSAVVLGMVGAGGLGYQLALSFTSLRWPQVWSAVYALALLCLAADVAGRAVRHRVAAPRRRAGALSRDRLLTAAVLGTVAAVAWSWWYLALAPASLLSGRTRGQVGYVLGAAWPPATDGDLLAEVGRQAVVTVRMSVLAVAVATVGAVLLAGIAAHPPGRVGPGRRAAGLVVRAALLLLRAVPPPVWALVLLFVLLPGVLPGALALGVYTLGVLGRLAAEAVEEADPRPRAALTALGARPASGWLYGVAPAAAGAVLAFALYRWEVAVRDTLLVGLLGAGGLGALLASELAAFDWPAVATVLVATVVLTLAVDLVGDRARRTLR
ncbi:phosphonate transport system permease protein [Geodermatophilus bullaregiensis]|uniref:PhnE/PtxC family ABC transporter permease n=1 Tax=Geodermatophilus bullaregiensis TaxID=1564160 RepID=UPI0019580C9E|nr:ABC transporter permease subunit [Geodermatophilus bullaregiensis]MBM7808161.1 phosphonate transport system permease protein [Geodermatophilus bullaregiensis]